MITRNSYSNVTSGRVSAQNTDALYQSLRKDYIDAKAIYTNLVKLRQQREAESSSSSETYDQSLSSVMDVKIASAKSVMDKAQLDFVTYAKSDVYKLGVQNEEAKRQFEAYKAQQEAAQAQIQSDKANLEATYKAELDKQKKKQMTYIFIGGAAVLGLGVLIFLKR